MPGMLKIETVKGAFGLYRVALRETLNAARRRTKYLWKVVRGSHDLRDAMHDLAMGRYHRALWALVKSGQRLRRLQQDGGTAADIDVLRIAFLAEAEALSQRIEANDFYQDTKPFLSHRVRPCWKEMSHG